MRTGPPQPPPDRPGDEPRLNLDDELIGLDPDDPEVQAFSAHLERTHRQRPGFTVEGYLSGVADFAEAAGHARGPRRLLAVVVVGLILLGVLVAVWEAAVFIMGTLL